MRKIGTCIAICGLSVCGSLSFAASESEQIWTGVNFIGPVADSERLSYKLELQYRASTVGVNLPEYGIAKFGLNYQQRPSILLGVAYALVPRNPTQQGNLKFENRLEQQIVWEFLARENLNLFSRTRLEQRQQNGQAGIAVRLRQKFIADFPGIISPSLTPEISNEFFLNLLKPEWLSQDTYSQNRAFVGLKWQASQHVTLYGGYMNQLQRRKPRANQVNHILYLMLDYYLDPA